ncbi:hypothetical protein [Nocardia arizonensis]|uniref:hypothetical protein n=1 Tax=Nocardia arizonensis TaxID=1141647 RepID=UPI0006D0A792|nr:hypothetical protein [Nocardia arizonensis]
MTDFHVVPEALKLEAERVRGAADYWANAHLSILNTMPMREMMFGNKGIDIVKKLQACTETLSAKLIDGKNSTDDAADKLMTCANHFTSVDADYYRKFGYIDEKAGY